MGGIPLKPTIAQSNKKCKQETPKFFGVFFACKGLQGGEEQKQHLPILFQEEGMIMKNSNTDLARFCISKLGVPYITGLADKS